MAQPDIWPIIHAERAVLAADLKGLTDAQWASPSLCPGWTVQMALAHMTSAATITPGVFFVKLAAAGFRFEAYAAKEIARYSQGSGADTLAAFNERVNSSTHPPGPGDTWLGETIVHSEDIRRALGIKRDYPADACARVANFYRGSNLLIGGKKRAAGLTLRATDTDWSAGTGPEVAGPAVSLAIAVAGRAAGLADLKGDGVDTLKSRM